MWASLCCSFDVSAGASLHEFLPPPAPPTKGSLAPAIEIPIPQWWPIGVASGTCKFTSTVKYNGFTIVLEDHECGKLIPQVTLPPPNSFIPILMAKSSRKVIFSSAKVRMNGAATACAASNSMPWLMLTCGDPVSMPLTVPLTNSARPVRVGMTEADVWGGVINAAGAMAADYVTKDTDSAWVKNTTKSMIAGAAGFVASGVQHHLDPEYPYKASGTFFFEGGFNAGVDLQWGSSDTTRHPSQVKTRASYSTGYDVKKDDPDTRVAGVGASAEATYTWDAGENEDAEGWSGKAGKQMGVEGMSDKDEVEYRGGNVTVKNETKAFDGSSSSTQYDSDKDEPTKNVDVGPSADETAGELWDML